MPNIYSLIITSSKSYLKVKEAKNHKRQNIYGMSYRKQNDLFWSLENKFLNALNFSYCPEFFMLPELMLRQ